MVTLEPGKIHPVNRTKAMQKMVKAIRKMEEHHVCSRTEIHPNAGCKVCYTLGDLERDLSRLT